MPDLTVPLPVPLEDLAAAFLANVSVSTRIAYRRDLERFVSWSGARSLADAARTLLQRGHGHANGVALAYRGHLVASELAPNTINRRLSALRALVRFARVLWPGGVGARARRTWVVKYREYTWARHRRRARCSPWRAGQQAPTRPARRRGHSAPIL